MQPSGGCVEVHAVLLRWRVVVRKKDLLVVTCVVSLLLWKTLVNDGTYSMKELCRFRASAPFLGLLMMMMNFQALGAAPRRLVMETVHLTLCSEGEDKYSRYHTSAPTVAYNGF